MLVSLSFTGAAEASKRSPRAAEDFTMRWRASPLQVEKKPEGEYRQKVMERVIRFADGQAFGIGTITYLSIPKTPIPGDPKAYDADASARRILSKMRITDIRKRLVGKTEVFEGHWEIGGRFVRIMIHQNEKQFSTSVGLFRLPYLADLAQESEWIQRSLAGEIKANPSWIHWLLTETTNSLIPEAHAQGACPSCNGTPNPWQASQCAACTQAALLQGINQTNQSLGTIAAQIGPGNNNWANTNGQLATGAGAAAGAALIGVLTSGFSEVAEVIHEAVTHQRRDAALLAAFDKAMDQYSKIGPELRKTEAYIDSALYLLRMARDSGGREALILHFNERIRAAENHNTIARELELNAAKIGVSAACQAELNRNGARFDQLVRDLTQLRNRLQEVEEDSLCAELETQMRGIIQAEHALEAARARIINPLTNRVVSEAHEEKYREALRLAAEANNPAELSHSRTLEINLAEESYQAGVRAIPGLEANIQRAFQRCIEEMADGASPVTGFFARFPLIGPAVRAGVSVELSNGKSIPAPYYCRSQATDPESSYAYSYRHELAPLQRARRTRIIAADTFYREALARAKIVIDPATFVAARLAHQDFVATLSQQASQQAKQEMRIDALLQKQGEIRQLCPMLPNHNRD